MSYNDLIRLVQDGELVAGGVTNRPTEQLDQNVKALRDQLLAASIGEAIFARGRIVEAGAQVGMPVYYNGTSGRFERAVGGMDVDPDTGAFLTSVSTQVWGVVHTKYSSTIADIVLRGVVDLDLSASITETIKKGRTYYLSNVTPGAMQSQRPPVGVAVVLVGEQVASGKYTVYVNPDFKDLLESHKHYKFNLVAAPAGDTSVPVGSGIHVVTDVDITKEGWLPADDDSFGGKAPEGAKFGYNLAASKLATLWPPQPVEGAYLEWSRGSTQNLLGMGVPLGEDQLAIIDENGIWWLSNCYDDVPWPTDLDTSQSLSESFDATDCPRVTAPQVTLWFSKPTFSGSGTWVSELSVAENSGLSLTCPDTGAPATTGPLLLDFDPDLLLKDTNHDGYKTVKAIDGKQLLLGPVVSGLKAGGNNVLLSGPVAAEAGVHAGPVTISVDQSIEGREIDIDIARLEGVDEEFFAEVIALGFKAGRLATMRGRIQIPAVLDLPDTTTMKLRFWVLNRSSATVPSEIFALSYRRIAAPSAINAVADLPLSVDEIALTPVPTADITVTAANQYFLTESEPFTIAAGETILLSLTRDGSGDGFSGDLHLMRGRGIYVL